MERDLIFVTPPVEETGIAGKFLGAMAAAYIALVSPYNIDLQRRDVAGTPADVISARVVPTPYNHLRIRIHHK